MAPFRMKIRCPLGTYVTKLAPVMTFRRSPVATTTASTSELL